MATTRDELMDAGMDRDLARLLAGELRRNAGAGRDGWSRHPLAVGIGTAAFAGFLAVLAAVLGTWNAAGSQDRRAAGCSGGRAG